MNNANTLRILGLLTAGSLWMAPAFAGGAQLNKNLLSNGAAEAGEGSASGFDVLPVPKWTSNGDVTVVLYGAPDFPNQDSPGPTSRGLKFFAGGPNNAQSSLSRTVNLKALAADIDTGTVQGTLSGWLGGYSSQEDHADFAVTYVDASGASLGTVALQTVSATDRGSVTGMLKRKAVDMVPVGARTAQVTLTLTRESGSYNDGYADALSLVLTKKP